MPIVISQKQKIYYQIEGEKGPFLILHGPAIVPLECWYQSGYIEELSQNYRLIIIEPLGQGRSDAPKELQNYTIGARVKHVLDVVLEMKVDSFHFLGIGLGGQVGFAIAEKHSRRLRSLATLGAHPYALTTEMEWMEQAIKQLEEGKVENFLKEKLADDNVSQEIQELIKQGNPKGYAKTLKGMSQWEGVQKPLAEIQVSSLLYTATAEPRFLSVREAGRSMPHARYLILQQLDYENGLLESEQLITPLIDFIRKQRWVPNENNSRRRS